jgi:hypothetical protein
VRSVVIGGAGLEEKNRGTGRRVGKAGSQSAAGSTSYKVGGIS